jgi:hypothetical protein
LALFSTLFLNGIFRPRERRFAEQLREMSFCGRGRTSESRWTESGGGGGGGAERGKARQQRVIWGSGTSAACRLGVRCAFDSAQPAPRSVAQRVWRRGRTRTSRTVRRSSVTVDRAS